MSGTPPPSSTRDRAGWLIPHLRPTAPTGYHAAIPYTPQLRYLNIGGIIEHHRGQTTIR
jgi:hypothetical protein